jgi:ribosomal protein L15
MYNVNNYSNWDKNIKLPEAINEAWYDYVPDVLKSGVKKLIGDENYEAAKKLLVDSPEVTKKAEAAVNKLIKKKRSSSV